MNIHTHIADKVQLAQDCAKDGAFRTAAQRFRQLADHLDNHMQKIEDDFDIKHTQQTKD